MAERMERDSSAFFSFVTSMATTAGIDALFFAMRIKIPTFDACLA